MREHGVFSLDELKTILCCLQQFKTLQNHIEQSVVMPNTDFEPCELYNEQKTVAEMTEQVQNKLWIRHS